jgi:negative regulator of replication initiation
MATITISDDLLRAAEEYTRRTGESLDKLVERWLHFTVQASYLTAHDTASRQNRQQAIARLLALPPATTLPSGIDYQCQMREEQRIRYGFGEK